MHGNVWEWCQDRSREYPPDTRERPLEDVEDPAPVSDGDNRVLRGGAYTAAAAAIGSAARHRLRPTEHARIAGLRVARTWR